MLNSRSKDLTYERKLLLDIHEWMQNTTFQNHDNVANVEVKIRFLIQPLQIIPRKKKCVKIPACNDACESSKCLLCRSLDHQVRSKLCSKWVEYLQHSQIAVTQNIIIGETQRNSSSYYDVLGSNSDKTFQSLTKKKALSIRKLQEDINKIVRGKHSFSANLGHHCEFAVLRP